MGGKGGGGKKGGGGGSIDVDVDSESTSSMVLDIVGLDDIDITTNTTNESTSRAELAITEPIDTRLTLSVPDTIRTEQRQELAITEPIVTQMSADLDVKPIVLDLCLTVGIKDLPRVCISRPYDRHVGLSVMGQEVIGFNWCGNSQFIIDDVRPRTFVAGVTEKSFGPRSSEPQQHRHDQEHSRRGDGGPVVIDHDDQPGVRLVIE